MVFGYWYARPDIDANVGILVKLSGCHTSYVDISSVVKILIWVSVYWSGCPALVQVSGYLDISWSVLMPDYYLSCPDISLHVWILAQVVRCQFTCPHMPSLATSAQVPGTYFIGMCAEQEVTPDLWAFLVRIWANVSQYISTINKT